MSKKSKKAKTPKQRNTIAMHAIFRTRTGAGTHGSTKNTKRKERRKAKANLRKEIALF